MNKYLLTNSNIDIISDEIGAFLDKCKVDRKDAMRIKLAAEETLLHYQEQFGEIQEVTLDCRKRLGKARIVISVPAPRFNPFKIKDEQDESLNSNVLRGILANMGIAPVWEYKDGENLIIFTPKKKPPSQMVQLASAISAAVVCGGASMLLPDSVRIALSTRLIAPVFDTFMGLLAAIAGPMIFLSVAWGIYSIGDTATLGTIGKRMMNRFLIMTLVVVTLGVAAMLPFFPLRLEGAASFDADGLFKMILGIVPTNFFAPFVEGNPLQIIFVAFAIGLAMLILGQKTTIAATMVEQSNYIVQLLMETISKFVPYFVFGSILNIIMSDNFDALVKAYKVLPIMLLGQSIAVVMYLLLVTFRKKVSLNVLLKKLMPTFLIGLSTASSSAAFATNVETCEKKLGIDRRIVNFGVPLGQIVFMPGYIMIFIAPALCMAEIFGVSISPEWLVTAVIISIVLAIAAPPVPGGALSCLTMLFVQLNIPAEGIPIIIALNIIMDFFATAVNLTCLQMDLVELAGDLNMLDYNKLRKEMK
ncbi:MAG: cation:dicarboxylase symporter family transporter [Phascolarctobacterium sp.]|nr:cation:dicarboxylase symporter family transporter [Phascolarctobacterium sp.]